MSWDDDALREEILGEFDGLQEFQLSEADERLASRIASQMESRREYMREYRRLHRAQCIQYSRDYYYRHHVPKKIREPKPKPPKAEKKIVWTREFRSKYDREYYHSHLEQKKEYDKRRYESARKPSSRRCGACGKLGHSVQRCKDVDAVAWYRSVFVYRSKYCLKQARLGRAVKARRCGVCGEAGHDRRTCSRRQSDATSERERSTEPRESGTVVR